MKLPYFRSLLLASNATPHELIILGEFLDQGEYAEEILQIMYVEENIN